jgi:hypothetical protein
MRRAAGRAPDPNGQRGGKKPKPIRGSKQTVQNGPDLVPKYVRPLKMPSLLPKEAIGRQRLCGVLFSAFFLTQVSPSSTREIQSL